MYQYFKEVLEENLRQSKNNDDKAKKMFLSHIKFLLQDKYDETIESIITATYDVAKHKGRLEGDD